MQLTELLVGAEKYLRDWEGSSRGMTQGYGILEFSSNSRIF